MSDESTNKIALVNLPDMPESVDNALTNLTDFPTKNAGQTFGDLWYLVFGGISHAADKKRMKYAADLEKYRNELSDAISKIPDDKKMEPSFQVTAQALENSKYCVSSETLRTMFVKLISGSMNQNTESLVHPCFPEILKQLNENDALLLKDIFSAEQPFLPICNIGIHGNNTGHLVLYPNVFLPQTLELSYPLCSLSLSSLERAGLISIQYDTWINNEEAYSKLKETSMYEEAKAIDNGFNFENPVFSKGLVQLTHLGKAFSIVCIS